MQAQCLQSVTKVARSESNVAIDFCCACDCGWIIQHVVSVYVDDVTMEGISTVKGKRKVSFFVVVLMLCVKQR